jgi:hypothetical protein
MTTLHQLATEYTEKLNREAERKKNTIRKIARFAWGIFSYYKGPPVIDGDLSNATSNVAIQALSKQMQSGFQDVKLDTAAIEGIDLVTGWIMDLIRPSEMQLESQLGMLAMSRGLAGPGAMPMGMPGPYAMPHPAQHALPHPGYAAPHPGYAAPRPGMVGPPGSYGGGYPQRYPQHAAPFTGRIANQDGTWVYVANE